jgi:hypothetical protein
MSRSSERPDLSLQACDAGLLLRPDAIAPERLLAFQGQPPVPVAQHGLVDAEIRRGPPESHLRSSGQGNGLRLEFLGVLLARLRRLGRGSGGHG